MLKLELSDLGDLDVDLDSLGFGEGFPIDDPNFSPGTEDEQGKLDEKSPIQCPHCHMHFTP
jgi:hypothetical protein